MNIIAKSDILALSVQERILLVEDIWDSITEIPDEVQLTDQQKAELDLRLDAYHCNPEAGSPWEMVLDRVRRRA